MSASEAALACAVEHHYGPHSCEHRAGEHTQQDHCGGSKSIPTPSAMRSSKAPFTDDPHGKCAGGIGTAPNVVAAPTTSLFQTANDQSAHADRHCVCEAPERLRRIRRRDLGVMAMNADSLMDDQADEDELGAEPRTPRTAARRGAREALASTAMTYEQQLRARGALPA